MTKYRYSDQDFIIAVQNSLSVRETLIKLGVAPHGGSYKTFHLRVKKLDLSTVHFIGRGHLKGKNNPSRTKISLSDLLVKNSTRSLSVSHKQRIIDAELLNNECSKCHLKDMWQGEPIVLHLDHINGDHFDHQIENLRLLCPNCHSQTPTYCAKNKKPNPQKSRKSDFVPQEKHKCATCGISIDRRAKNCGACYDKHRKQLQAPAIQKTKINWPSKEELERELQTKSFSALSKELGVSDTAIRKHLKSAA